MFFDWEIYNYCQHLQSILSSNLLEKSFLSYFGEFYEREIYERLKNKHNTHVYIPDKELKVKLHNLYYQEIQILKISFLEEILNCFQIPIHSIETKNIFLYIEANFALYYLLGGPFLATFSLKDLKKSPFFCYKEFSLMEQENFLKHIYSSFDKESIFLKGVEEIGRKPEIQQILQHIQQCQKYLTIVDHLEDLRISNIIKNYQNPLYLEKKYEKRYMKIKDKTLAEINYNNKAERHVLLSVFVMLDIVWHEMTHFLLGERQFYVECGKKMMDAIDMEGCFYLSSFRNVSEVFSDYFSVQSFATIYSNIDRYWYQFWNMKSLYSNLFFLVEPFLKFFEPLMKYVSFYHLPKMLEEVFGMKNFCDYCSLFYKFNLREEEKNYLLLKAQSIIHDMCEHVKNYEVNYYEMVNSYVEDLKSQGKRVRVLDEGMKKLKKEEDLIIYTKNSLK